MLTRVCVTCCMYKYHILVPCDMIRPIHSMLAITFEQIVEFLYIRVQKLCGTQRQNIKVKQAHDLITYLIDTLGNVCIQRRRVAATLTRYVCSVTSFVRYGDHREHRNCFSSSLYRNFVFNHQTPDFEFHSIRDTVCGRRLMFAD